jgi:hypothetical protein
MFSGVPAGLTVRQAPPRHPTSARADFPLNLDSSPFAAGISSFDARSFPLGEAGGYSFGLENEIEFQFQN